MTENQEHGRKVTRLPLDCGLVAHVEPLPYFVLKGIRRQADKLYPDPPEEPYRLPFPESAIPDDYKPATENPEYIRLVNEATIKRSEYIMRSTILLSVDFEEDQKTLTADYAARREQVAQFVDDLPGDDWEATLLHCIIGDNVETSAIYNIAIGQEPLTQEEVHEGVRWFRRDLPKPANRRLVGETPGIS